MRVRAVTIVACLLMAGAMPFAVSEETSISQEADLTLEPGQALRLHPTGAPWGRVEVTATQAMNVSLNLTHDTIDDLTWATDEGRDIYDERHYTFLYVEPKDEGLVSFGSEDFSFEWWGAPNWSLSPHRFGNQSWSMEAGETLIVLLANNVEGYNITLEAGDDPDPTVRDLAWELEPREGLNLFLPESDDTVVERDDTRVRRRTWDASAVVPSSFIKARRWDYERPAGPETTVFVDHVDAHMGVPAGWPTFGDLGTWQWGVHREGDGGLHRSLLEITRTTTEPMPVWYHRKLHHAETGVDDDVHGAAFFSIPWRATDEEGLGP